MRGNRIILAALVSLALVCPARGGTAGAPGPKADKAKPGAAEKKETPQAKAERLFDEGRDALFRGRYKKAAELLGQAAAIDKTKTRYRLYLARAHRYAGNTDEAEKLLGAIVKASPDHVEAGQLLGEVYAEQEKWKQVVDVLQRVLKYRHDYPTYHMLAEAKYNLDDHKAARKYFLEAIKLNPKSPADHYQLGNIYLAGNFFALAAESYQKALGLGLHSSVLHYKLGTAYFNLRNYFGRVREVTVKSGKVGSISGQWYLIEPVPGRNDVFRAAPSHSAIYQVAKAIEAGMKDNPDIRLLRTNIYLNARRYRRAYEMFRQLAASAPKPADDKRTKEDKALFHYCFAQAAFGVGKYDEYLQLLKKAIELDGPAYKATLLDAYLRVAEQNNQQGNIDGYIQYLRLAVDEAPKKAGPHLKLGYAYEEAHQYAQAIVQWRMVLDIEPDHPKRIALLDLVKKYQMSATSRPAAKAG
ncbi:MAG TPA: tetratricopeptide repeat protein [Phycisphaerae bacterium]|nr:tetratricopeptide repeat protein [Phycisphaerae bacterium]